MKKISPSKKYVVMYLPDYSGFVVFGEYDTSEEALIGWERAIMSSPIERPLLLQNLAVRIGIEAHP